MKKVLSLLLCVALLVSLALPASASLQYTYIDSVAASIDINEFWGIASCDGDVNSIDPNLLKVSVSLRVYKNGQWETLKTWTNTGNNFVAAGGDYAIARGYKYQTYVAAYVYDDAGHIIEGATVSDEMYY